MDRTDSGIMTLLIVAGVIAAFFILRELMLWYWKINDIVKNQDEQIRLLKKIAGEPSEAPEKFKSTIGEKE